jgi:hypothetical protein
VGSDLNFRAKTTRETSRVGHGFFFPSFLKLIVPERRESYKIQKLSPVVWLLFAVSHDSVHFDEPWSMKKERKSRSELINNNDEMKWFELDYHNRPSVQRSATSHRHPNNLVFDNSVQIASASKYPTYIISARI